MYKDLLVTSLALFCGLAGCGAVGSNRVEDRMKEHSNRFEIGIRVLREVGGEKYDAPLRSLDNIARDLARFTVEFAYGDIMSRKALDLRTRQIATVAALAAWRQPSGDHRSHTADGGVRGIPCRVERRCCRTKRFRGADKVTRPPSHPLQVDARPPAMRA
jgi:alkylhydroperoxidase/carboxymuconolactone decarboxylase family protein YurZ